MKKNLYIFQDRLSKVYGDIYESENDETMRRTFLRVVPMMYRDGVPVRDILVFRVGSIDKAGLLPVIIPELVPEVVLRGDENDCVRACEEAIPAYSGDSV